MIHFIGAGPGAADLITLRGKTLLEEADIVIYAGSLVNPELLSYTKTDCTVLNSAKMTLEEVIDVMRRGEQEGKTTVRLHTGDPCIYGAIREQMDVLDTLTPREMKVLKLRFGLEDGRARTLEEVGKEFQVTRERIRQIEAKALRKLRHPSRSKKLRDYLE